MSDAVNPKHYKGFSNGAETIDILENLLSNCSNTAKYSIRAGRADGNTKHDLEGRIEDMKKARWYADREVQRLEGLREEQPPQVLEDFDLDSVLSKLRQPAYQDYEAVLTIVNGEAKLKSLQTKGNNLNG